MKLILVCEGEHVTAPVLGQIELPDNTPPVTAAAAQSGHLCEDCGFAYTYLVNEYQQGRPGIAPRSRISAAAVDVALQAHGKSRARQK